MDKIKAELVPFGHPTEICLSFVASGQPICFSHTHYDNYRENLTLLTECWNEHDTLKAFIGEIKDYFVDNCEDCKTESISDYGEHGKEGCKSCLSGKLLATAKELK